MQNSEAFAAKLRALGIRPPVAAAGCLVVAFILNTIVPLTVIASPDRRYAAILLWALGLTLGVLALGLFHRRGTTHDPFGKPSALAAAGPYRLSRNPMYLGVALILVGVAVARGTAAWFIAPAAFVWIVNALFIPGEERLLENLFGDEYRAYKKRVRRWV